MPLVVGVVLIYQKRLHHVAVKWENSQHIHAVKLDEVGVKDLSTTLHLNKLDQVWAQNGVVEALEKQEISDEYFVYFDLVNEFEFSFIEFTFVHIAHLDFVACCCLFIIDIVWLCNLEVVKRKEVVIFNHLVIIVENSVCSTGVLFRQVCNEQSTLSEWDQVLSFVNEEAGYSTFPEALSVMLQNNASRLTINNHDWELVDIDAFVGDN